jgi:aspartate kinase
MQVLKFGGTSVGQPHRMHQIGDLITRDKAPKIVVLSALSGTTNTLVKICALLHEQNYDQVKATLGQLRDHCDKFVIALLNESSFRENAFSFLNEHFEFLNATVDVKFSASIEKEILAQGELISTKLFKTYLDEKQISASLIQALDFMKIDEAQEPDIEFIETNLSKILSDQSDTPIFITQGFVCQNHLGEIDNLKRGGSDYTASLIGSAIKASEIQIWTDIDGMHNNDPRVVKNTIPISELSFDEAVELAYFGAKILHPASIWPAQKFDIPVKLLNTMQPEAKGTTISHSSISDDIKAIAAKDGITAIKVKSSRMLLAYGFLTKIFQVFERFKTPIDMITTSEVAVSLTIDDKSKILEIKKELEPLGLVEIDNNQTIICIVGNFVSEKKGVVNYIFEALKEVPIRMISYGGSRHNISILVDSYYKKEVLEKLNKHLFGL